MGLSGGPSLYPLPLPRLPALGEDGVSSAAAAADTVPICAGEIWRSCGALGHQDHLPHH